MTLIDDTFDCCGRRFDQMGGPWLIRGKGYTVYCHGCRGKYPDNCSCRDCVDKAILSAKAEGWDERSVARPSYLGPNDGHYEDCVGWPDCYCGTYPNPYREVKDV